MQSTPPTLSILIANYNHAQYLSGALQEILGQSRPAQEIIIVDDASSDQSAFVVAKFQAQGAPITLLVNAQNKGAVFSFNRALHHAKGDYVYFAASDDVVRPTFFEKSMQLLERYPEAGLCCCDPASFESEDSPITPNPMGWSRTSRFFSPWQFARRINGGYVAGHASIMRRDCVLAAGGYNEKLKWHCDWFLQLEIAFRYGICYIPEPLATIRVLPQSYSATGTRDRVAQTAVLSEILRLLCSPRYRTLISYFARGSVLSHFGDGILRVVATHPKFWNAKVWRLTRREWFNFLKRSVGQHLPPSVLQWVRAAKSSLYSKP